MESCGKTSFQGGLKISKGLEIKEIKKLVKDKGKVRFKHHLKCRNP